MWRQVSPIPHSMRESGRNITNHKTKNLETIAHFEISTLMNSLINIRYSSHLKKIIKIIYNHSSGGKETLTSLELITLSLSSIASSALLAFHSLFISIIPRVDSANSETFLILTIYTVSWPCLMAIKRYLIKLVSSILLKSKSV